MVRKGSRKYKASGDKLGMRRVREQVEWGGGKNKGRGRQGKRITGCGGGREETEGQRGG